MLKDGNARKTQHGCRTFSNTHLANYRPEVENVSSGTHKGLKVEDLSQIAFMFVPITALERY